MTNNTPRTKATKNSADNFFFRIMGWPFDVIERIEFRLTFGYPISRKYQGR